MSLVFGYSRCGCHRQARLVYYKKIPQLEKYREQIKVYTYDEWYLKSSDTYDAEAIMQEWTKQCEYARGNNYDGIRVCGSPVWNHKNTWKKIMEYETVLEERIGCRSCSCVYIVCQTWKSIKFLI